MCVFFKFRIWGGELQPSCLPFCPGCTNDRTFFDSAEGESEFIYCGYAGFALFYVCGSECLSHAL